MLPPGTALVTGASSGIGATYAERLARRGHDLVLVARNADRLNDLTARLIRAHNIRVAALPADLSDPVGRAVVTQTLRENASISIVVNSAGLGTEGLALDGVFSDLKSMANVNMLALQELTLAAAHSFRQRRTGAIINIGSVVSLMPEQFNAVYAATKAFVLTLTQGLSSELADSGVRLQAVLPGLTRTELFERSAIDVNRLDPAMIMAVEDLVDAALAGFEQGEVVTIPSLSDAGLWASFEQARRQLMPHLSRDRPAERYGVEPFADNAAQ